MKGDLLLNSLNTGASFPYQFIEEPADFYKWQCFNSVDEKNYLFNTFKKPKELTHDILRNYFEEKYPQNNFRVEFSYRKAKYFLILVRINSSAFAEVSYAGGDLFFEVMTSKMFVTEQIVADFKEKFDLQNPINNSTIYAWWYFMDTNGDMKSSQMPVKKVDKIHQEFYPFIPEMNSYIDRFFESDENVLIFTGEPGTGKSTFIRHLIYHSKQTPIVAYDERVMSIDKFFIDFITGSRDLMILEDADLLLKSRLESGNKIMSKILNMADGIIDTSKKKFIFTANINNTRDIDEALIRPGRCFDIKKFRPLTFDEANNAAEKAGIKFHAHKSEYSLAEIYNPSKEEESDLSSTVGFR